MSKILWRKGGKTYEVDYSNSPIRPNMDHSAIAPSRVVALDTESFPYRGKLTTTLITLAHEGGEDAYTLEANPFVRVLIRLVELYGQKMPQTDLTYSPKRRGSRRQAPTVLLVAYNGEYEFSRFVADDSFWKRILTAGNAGMHAWTMHGEALAVLPYTLHPWTSAPNWDMAIWHKGRAIRLISRDLWGYFKSGLGKTAQLLTGQAKMDVEKELPYPLENIFHRPWESFTEDERRTITAYCKRDSRLTRLSALALYDLMEQFGRAYDRRGIFPVSAPSYAAKLTAKIAGEEIPKVGMDFAQLAADSYGGARTFGLYQGFVSGLNVADIHSAYPSVMLTLPDPRTAERIRITPGAFDPERFILPNGAGRTGIVRISGTGMEDRYPAIAGRLPDGRLTYIVGDFHGIATTLPEVMAGVLTGRLRNVDIEEGFILHGDAATSPIAELVRRFRALKERSPKNSAAYEFAKLVQNAAYGKLVELILDTFPIPQEDAQQLVHYLMDDYRQEYLSAYLAGGIDGMEQFALDILDQNPDASNGLGDLATYLTFAASGGRMGSFAMPDYGALVTGTIRGYLGLAAWATGAVQGDTDSIFTVMPIDRIAATFDSLRSVARASAMPDLALGDHYGQFGLELVNGRGVLAGIKRYVLMDDKGNRKRAYHALPGIRPSDDLLLALYSQVLPQTSVAVRTRERPIRLRDAIINGRTPGQFQRKVVMLSDKRDDRMEGGRYRMWQDSV
jgi:hypothetical protein